MEWQDWIEMNKIERQSKNHVVPRDEDKLFAIRADADHEGKLFLFINFISSRDNKIKAPSWVNGEPQNDGSNSTTMEMVNNLWNKYPIKMKCSRTYWAHDYKNLVLNVEINGKFARQYLICKPQECKGGITCKRFIIRQILGQLQMFHLNMENEKRGIDVFVGCCPDKYKILSGIDYVEPTYQWANGFVQIDTQMAHLVPPLDYELQYSPKESKLILKLSRLNRQDTAYEFSFNDDHLNVRAGVGRVVHFHVPVHIDLGKRVTYKLSDFPEFNIIFEFHAKESVEC